MAGQQPVRSGSTASVEKEADIQVVENAQQDEGRQYLEHFDLLQNKTKDELDSLNKKVLRKLDWRFLPCITAMLLMK